MPLLKKPKKPMEEKQDKEGSEKRPSLSLALSAQKMAKRKKMAHGGKVASERPSASSEVPPQSIVEAIMRKRRMAEGGESPEAIDDLSLDDLEYMAHGGMVDLEENSMEQPNYYYKRNREILKENYDEDIHSVSQPMDSNEHDVEIESDKHDRIDQMRKKALSKRSR